MLKQNRPVEFGPGDPNDLVPEVPESVLAPLLGDQRSPTLGAVVLDQAIELDDRPLPPVKEVHPPHQSSVGVPDLHLRNGLSEREGPQ